MPRGLLVPDKQTKDACQKRGGPCKHETWTEWGRLHPLVEAEEVRTTRIINIWSHNNGVADRGSIVCPGNVTRKQSRSFFHLAARDQYCKTQTRTLARFNTGHGLLLSCVSQIALKRLSQGAGVAGSRSTLDTRIIPGIPNPGSDGRHIYHSPHVCRAASHMCLRP